MSGARRVAPVDCGRRLQSVCGFFGDGDSWDDGMKNFSYGDLGLNGGGPAVPHGRQRGGEDSGG